VAQWLQAYLKSQTGLGGVVNDPVFKPKIDQVAADIQKNKGVISNEDGKLLWDALWQYSKLAKGMNRDSGAGQQTDGQAPTQQAQTQQTDTQSQESLGKYADLVEFFKKAIEDPSVLQDRTYKKFTDFIKEFAKRIP
jgi:hypothetical protein